MKDATIRRPISVVCDSVGCDLCLVPCDPLESDFCPSGTCEQLASDFREQLASDCCPRPSGAFVALDRRDPRPFASPGSFSLDPAAPPPPEPKDVQGRKMESLVSWDVSPCVMDKLIVRGSVMVGPAAALPAAAFHGGGRGLGWTWA